MTAAVPDRPRRHAGKSKLAPELDRLKAERDAILRVLADHLKVSEAVAWQIVRLDMEDQ